MKAIIEYNIPDDKFELDCAIKSVKMYFALTEIKAELRSVLKYGSLKENEYEIYEKVQEKFFDILADNEINLDLC